MKCDKMWRINYAEDNYLIRGLMLMTKHNSNDKMTTPKPTRSNKKCTNATQQQAETKTIYKNACH